MLTRLLLLLALVMTPAMAFADIAPPPDSGGRDAGTAEGGGGCAVARGENQAVAWMLVPLAAIVVLRRRRA